MSANGGAPMSVAQAQDILDQHNCHRARYGVAPLEWDWTLAANAKQHADACAWGHSANAERPGQGENLAANSNAVDGSLWFAEETDWQCGVPFAQSCRGGRMCGHWTQAIWDGTKRVGCAIANCPSGLRNTDARLKNYLVCRYSPPGNYTSQQPTTQCTPDNSINCRNVATASFARPLVPTPPNGGGGGGVAKPPQPVPSNGGGRAVAQPQFDPYATTGAAVVDARRAQPQQQQEQQQQQERQEQQTRAAQRYVSDINGVRVYYSAQLRPLIERLDDAQRSEMAERVRHIAPNAHADVIQAYLRELNQEAVGAKQLFPRASQRPILESLSKAQFAAVYERVKHLPTNVQHCGIERYFVAQGVAMPTQYCAQVPLDMVAFQPPLLPGQQQPSYTRTEMLQEQQQRDAQLRSGARPGGERGRDGEDTSRRPWDIPVDLQDRAPIGADEAVLVQSFGTTIGAPLPWWAWLAIGVAVAIVLLALVAFLSAVSAYVYKRRRQRKAVSGFDDVKRPTKKYR